MGAYYEATINKDRYSTWSIKQGAKLMEHGYVGNDYVENVLSLLEKNPQPLQWLCDYTEDGLTWENTVEHEFTEDLWSYRLQPTYFILNHTKNLYIDIREFICGHSLRSFMIHPLVILCNSEKSAMGGGDYRKDESSRGSWKGDIIEITYCEEKVDALNFENVTKDCRFYE